jgi:hypothetical protein
MRDEIENYSEYFSNCSERLHPTADAPLNEVYPADRQ